MHIHRIHWQSVVGVFLVATCSIAGEQQKADAPAVTPTWRFKNHIASLAFTKGGDQLVVADGRLVRVLDAKSGKEIRNFKAQPYHINSMDLAGDKVAVTGGDSKIYVWDVKQKKRLLTLHSHRNGSQNVRISPDGRFVAATGDDVSRKPAILVWTDYSVRVWDTNTGKQVPSLADGLRTGTCGVFSPDSKRLAWNARDGVQLISLPEGKMLFRTDCGVVNDFAFSPDGSVLACGTSKGISILDVATGKESRRLVRKAIRPVGITNWRIAISPDGKKLAACSEDGSVVVWDFATGKEIGRLHNSPKNTQRWIDDIAFSPDSTTLAVAVQDYTVRLWDVATMKQMNAP